MALAWLRRWSRVVAVLVLAASVRGLPHLEIDDLGCLPIVEQHDETRHGIRPAAATHAPEHCGVCHLTRSLRAPRPIETVWRTKVVPSFPISGPRRALPHAPVAEDLPARAPPIFI